VFWGEAADIILAGMVWFEVSQSSNPIIRIKAMMPVEYETRKHSLFRSGTVIAKSAVLLPSLTQFSIIVNWADVP
jgi:hypothetical protein